VTPRRDTSTIPASAAAPGRTAGWRRCRALLLVAVCLAPGCSSVRSWDQCADLYSGVRYNRERFAQVPLDGKVFFTLDLPASVLFDTLALPVTVFADPKRPTGGFPAGCRWAARR
jgi:uncharacterized protein YceK